jgi:hypothetical protein
VINSVARVGYRTTQYIHRMHSRAPSANGIRNTHAMRGREWPSIHKHDMLAASGLEHRHIQATSRYTRHPWAYLYYYSHTRILTSKRTESNHIKPTGRHPVGGTIICDGKKSTLRLICLYGTTQGHELNTTSSLLPYRDP